MLEKYKIFQKINLGVIPEALTHFYNWRWILRDLVHYFSEPTVHLR